MININNNNILYSEVAPLTGDVISPSFRDRKKLLLIKTHSQDARITLVIILIRLGRAFNKNSHYNQPTDLLC